MPNDNAAILAHPTHFSAGLFIFCCLRQQVRVNWQKFGVQYPFSPDFSAFSCDVGCLVYTGSSFKLPENGFTPRPSSKSDVNSKLVDTTCFPGFTLLQLMHEGTWWEGQRQKKQLRQSILKFDCWKNLQLLFDISWRITHVWYVLMYFLVELSNW